MHHIPILHHFEVSPFSEKVRAIFGLKQMTWRSVLIPMAMPKPDVTALTGGYRKTPILQMGADIYCDTALIAQVLDALQPNPPLVGHNPMAPMAAAWADGTLFWQAIMNTQAPEARARIYQGLSPEGVQHLRDDRHAFLGGLARPNTTDAAAQLQSALGSFEQALSMHPWLLGPQPSIADFSVYHCIWFLARAGVADTLLDPWPSVRDWYARIRTLGHGRRTEISSADAIALAASAGHHAPVQFLPGMGFQNGDAVIVAATDYGTDQVRGTLVGITHERATIARQDDRAGWVHVHFPRLGYSLISPCV